MSKCLALHPAQFKPSRAHLFVCVNRRTPGDPLGAGCGARGDEVYARLKRATAQAGLVSSVYVTRTYCLSVCPSRGTAVAVSPHGELLSEVTVDDVPAVLALATASRREPNR